MILRPLFRLPTDTSIRFVRGRFAGLIVSAILSTASLVLFFYPGVNYSIDFRGGTVVELRLQQAADIAEIRAAFDSLRLGTPRVQTLGRTIATSSTVLLSILPLAVMGGEAIRGFALAIIFGIVVGTSSSIFIASPILLFLGQRRLRREPYWKAAAESSG